MAFQVWEKGPTMFSMFCWIFSYERFSHAFALDINGVIALPEVYGDITWGISTFDDTGFFNIMKSNKSFLGKNVWQCELM